VKTSAQLARRGGRSFGSQPRLTRITQIDFSRTDNRPVAPESNRGRTFAKAGLPIHDSRFTPARPGRRGDRPPTSDLRRLTSGFTLIELLVVIIMIAILASLLYPAINGAQNQAKKVQAKNDVTQIVSAVNAYYTEYGKYPLAASDGSVDTVFGTTLTNDNLFNVLRANGQGRDTVDPTDTTGNKNLNPRRIVFINLPNVKDPTNPRAGIGTTTGVNQFFDPWGTPYKVEIDGNYNNQIETNPYPDSDGSAGATPLRLGVIAWSYGSDQSQGIKGTGKFKNSDDVISWQ
jgi:prepilin-type N-terminal cleavage/methylation domain-containing protein